MVGSNLTYVGHATALLEIGGERVLTDPMLRQRVGFLRRQVAAVDAGSFGDLDAVLISHAHHDHLDLGSLRALDRNTRLVVARGIGPLVAGLGFREVVELSPGEQTAIGSIRLTATAAAHGGRRGLRGPAAETLGFLLDAEGTRVYFAGDTDLFDGMSALAPLDLALLPVWGWGPKLGHGHLDPKRAAEALALLRPRMAVPIHWGTLFPIGLKRLKGTVLHEPPRAFARHAKRAAPEVDVRIVEPGDSISLGSII